MFNTDFDALLYFQIILGVCFRFKALSLSEDLPDFEEPNVVFHNKEEFYDFADQRYIQVFIVNYNNNTNTESFIY